MSEQLPVTRAELAKLLGNDQNLIIRFERLYTLAEQSLPNRIDGTDINAAASSSGINQLIALLGRVEQRLEELNSAPLQQQVANNDTIDVINHDTVLNDSPLVSSVPVRGFTGSFNSTQNHTVHFENGIAVRHDT